MNNGRRGTNPTLDSPILPGATIGILGGGQLGRMSAMAAKRMGYRVVVLTPEVNSPCAQVCDQDLVAPYDDPQALETLLQQAQVVTYEFENVPAQAVARLESQGLAFPSSRILEICQHRLKEKQALRELGIPTADFAAVRSLADLEAAAARLGYPCVLKTVSGGYDGKGQYVIRSADDLAPAYAALSPLARELILEAFVSFERELSIIVARNRRGECATFPLAENLHVQNILHRTLAPAPVSEAKAQEAAQLGRRIAEGMDLVGLISVELFDTPGGLLVNELAPRPHNSGHFTLEACVTSQFEQHIRAVCGLPLGSTAQWQPAVMLNILGQHLPGLLANLEKVLRAGDVKVHLYGKSEARHHRKMGHVTILAPTPQAALERAEAVWRLITGDRGQPSL